MPNLRAIFAGIALFIATSVPGFAQGTGAQGYFQIHNDTPEFTIVAFYVSSGGPWSRNWLDRRMEPGQSTRVRFREENGPCDIFVMVGWLGENGGEVRDEPFRIDICEATNLYLGDNSVVFD